MSEVIGLGTDITECLRIARMIERHGELFIDRVYTPDEIKYCQSRKQSTQHFTGRWAAKEGTGKYGKVPRNAALYKNSTAPGLPDPRDATRGGGEFRGWAAKEGTGKCPRNVARESALVMSHGKVPYKINDNRGQLRCS